MPRKPQTLNQMTKELTTANSRNKLYNSQSNREENDKQISDIVAEKMKMLADARSRGKINLNSIDDVEAVTMIFLESCRRRGNLPTFEGLAVALGYSRQNLYYIIKTRNDEVATFLDNCRTLFADIVQTASSKRIIDNATSIFILKSMTGLGFTDKNDELPDLSEMSDDIGGSSDYKKKYANLIAD